MKKARFLCLVLSFMVLGSVVSYAQTQRANIPKFTPTVGWQISPTEMASVRGLEALKLPCIMKAGYNNGFVLRFSGGGNRIMAMAIDFRQRVFTRDKVYNARININRASPRSIQATAFSESVLIFNLKNAGNLYRQLANARTLGLEVEGNSMEFSLGNIKESLQKLERCYSKTTGQKTTRMSSENFPQAMMKSTARPSSQPAPQIYSGSDLSRPRISRPVADDYVPADYSTPRVAGSELAKSMREPRHEQSIKEAYSSTAVATQPVMPKRIEKLEMPSTMPDVTRPAPLPRPTSLRGPIVSKSIDDEPAATPAVKQTQTASIGSMSPVREPIDLIKPKPASESRVWNANAGDDMRAVLQLWAGRAGVDLQWEATNSGKVASDVSVTGTFEEAVQTLMAQNAAALGLEADLRDDRGFQQASASSGAGWQGSMGGSKWVAASGASLRETLQSWSVREGVAFLWKAGKEYKVKAPIQNNGDYTEALQELLNQYANDTIRPAAQFNVDPSTGNKLLTVE